MDGAYKKVIWGLVLLLMYVWISVSFKIQSLVVQNENQRQAISVLAGHSHVEVLND